jgi:hypothetical protein
MSELDDLLGRLDESPRQPVSYRGRAIGKDKKSIHLAVPTGVIAIPLADITEVRGIEQAGVSADVVQVDVSDPARVVQIRRVAPWRSSALPKGSETVLLASDNASNYTWTAFHQETVTITAGAPDATDDGDDGFHADEDVPQLPEPIFL